MIPPLRVLDKIRRQQQIPRTTVIELLNTRDTIYRRLVSKHAGKTPQARIEAYAYLLRFTENEIAAIVEYNNRYNLYKEYLKKFKDDSNIATLLANLVNVWQKLPEHEKKELHAKLLQTTLKHTDALPTSFLLVLNDCNSDARGK